MSTIFKLKRGSGAPGTSVLAEYELGWDYTNKTLYIGTTSAPVKILDSFQNYLSVNETTGVISVGSTITLTGSTGAISSSGDLTVNNAVVNGDLTVNGTQTTINSTTTSVSDPFFTIGSSPSSADTYDRGIQFDYGTTSTPIIGFFGWDRSSNRFKFIPQATQTSSVFSGTLGDIEFGQLWMPLTNGVYASGGTITNVSSKWNITSNALAGAENGVQYDLLQNDGTSYKPTKTIPAASGITIDCGTF